jgi:hypothetical protein
MRLPIARRFSIPGPLRLAYDAAVAGIEASGESMNLRRLLLALFLAVFAAGTAPLHAETNVLFIFDSSGSMKKKIDTGEARMTVAKRAMAQALKDMPADVRVGLLLYGHRKAKDCTDIELTSPIGADDAAAIAKRITELKPKGETPIAAALEQAIRSFAALKGSPIGWFSSPTASRNAAATCAPRRRPWPMPASTSGST